jgi:uncharacterized protein YbbC (DUF1343 family)
MRVGLDRLPSLPRLVAELSSRRVALLAHPASLDTGYRHIAAVLASLGIRPKIVFGPEHGYGGEAQDMVGVRDAVDANGTRIVSLYGETFDELIPTDEHLTDIDLLLIDLADVGSRYYTFIWTALLCLRKAAGRGVQTIILDRPNPLGGVVSEGALVERGFESFVGLEAVPVRHALTLGEIVALFAAREGLAMGEAGALRIVSCENFGRDATAFDWKQPFVTTSPNMPTADTALVYPGGCLVEGTNLSEGRGTTRPFELVGAPFIDGARLARDLAVTKLPGFIARPLTFMPMFQKHAKSICGGVQIHVTDRAAFRPYATYLALVAAAHAQAHEQFRFRTEKYEFIDHIPAFDLLTGSAKAREAILRGEPLASWLEPIATAPADWADVVRGAEALAATAAVGA